MFLGYGAEDPNIKNILSDIDELLAGKGELVKNIFFVEWKAGCETQAAPMRERVLSIEDGKAIRVRNITADSYEWVFNAFASRPDLQKVSPKLLRALQSRFYQLVRTDIPQRSIHINFETLVRVTEDVKHLPSLMGLTMLDDPNALNVKFRYLLTEVAIQLGFTHANFATHLIVRIKNEKGIDIKASDNNYHRRQRNGLKNAKGVGLYSDECVELLCKVRDNEEYEVDLRIVPPLIPDPITILDRFSSALANDVLPSDACLVSTVPMTNA